MYGHPNHIRSEVRVEIDFYLIEIVGCIYNNLAYWNRFTFNSHEVVAVVNITDGFDMVTTLLEPVVLDEFKTKWMSLLSKEFNPVVDDDGTRSLWPVVLVITG